MDYYKESVFNSYEGNLVVIQTANGETLKVTSGHPLIKGNGYLVLASQIKEGDFLVTEDGSKDKVVSVSRLPYEGKVFFSFKKDFYLLSLSLVCLLILSCSPKNENNENFFDLQRHIHTSSCGNSQSVSLNFTQRNSVPPPLVSSVQTRGNLNFFQNSFLSSAHAQTLSTSEEETRTSSVLSETSSKNTRCDLLEENEISSKAENGFLDLVRACNASEETCFDKKTARCLCEDKTKAAYFSNGSFSCGMAKRRISKEPPCVSSDLNSIDLNLNEKIKCLNMRLRFRTNNGFYFGIFIPEQNVAEQSIDSIFQWMSQSELPIPLANASLSERTSSFSIRFSFGEYLPLLPHSYWISKHLKQLFRSDLLYRFDSMHGVLPDIHWFYYFEPEVSLEHLQRALGLEVTQDVLHPAPTSEEFGQDEELKKILLSLHKIHTIYGKDIFYENFKTPENCRFQCDFITPLSNVEVSTFLRSQWEEDASTIRTKRSLLYIGGALFRHLLLLMRNSEVLGVVQLNFSNEVSSYVSYKHYFDADKNLLFDIRVFNRNWQKMKESPLPNLEGEPEEENPAVMALSRLHQEAIQNRLQKVSDISNPPPITLFCDSSLRLGDTVNDTGIMDRYDLDSILVRGPSASESLPDTLRDTYTSPTSLMGWFKNETGSPFYYFDGLVEHWNIFSHPGVHPLAVVKDYEMAYKKSQQTIIENGFVGGSQTFSPKAGLISSCYELKRVDPKWMDMDEMYEHNVRVMSMSLGFFYAKKTCEQSQFARNVRFTEDKMLWIVSSGNINVSNPQSHYNCPGTLGIRDNLLIVSDDQSKLTRGVNYADIVEREETYEREDPLLKRTGTSFATPKVSAQAALLQAHFPRLKPKHLRWALLAGASIPYEINSIPRTETYTAEEEEDCGFWAWIMGNCQTKTSTDEEEEDCGPWALSTGKCFKKTVIERTRTVYDEEKEFHPYEVRSGGKADIICSYKAAQYINDQNIDDPNWNLNVSDLVKHLDDDTKEVEYRIDLYRETNLID